MDTKKFYLGIDAGTTYVKAVIVNDSKEIIGTFVHPTGTDHADSLKTVGGGVLEAASITKEALAHTTATGFGRDTIEFADSTKTEISCHARGAYHHFPQAITIIDIGGQDTKIIQLDESGKRIGFKMNRKCAAGTGAFLNEIAQKLEVPLNELNSMAMGSDLNSPLSSFCTVFASTEILQRMKDGERIEDLVRGAYESVIRRVIEMEELEGTIIMTGGVIAYHPIIAEILGGLLDMKIRTPPLPQLTGALGAALFARQSQ